MRSRSVVITGRGIVSPLGVGFDRHWSAIVRGERATGPVPRLAALGLESSGGAEVRPEMLAEHLAKHPSLHDIVWKTVKLASKNKQSVDATAAAELQAAVNQVSDIFCETKKA